MTGVVSGTAGNVGDDPDTVSANAEHVGVNAPGNANTAIVFPAVALATSTALGPMLQPSPSTSENSINVV